MKALLLPCEAGIILLDEESKVLGSCRYESSSAFKEHRQTRNGEVSRSLKKLLEETARKGVKEFLVESESLKQSLSMQGFVAEIAPNSLVETAREKKIDLLMDSGLVSNDAEAKELVRSFALEVAEEKLRDLSSKPDLHAIQCVQALDETDKHLNILFSRVKEWYGLHFPELASLVDDQTYIRMVRELRGRGFYTQERLTELGISEKRRDTMVAAARDSKGGGIRDGDLDVISGLAEHTVALESLRKKLVKHLEDTMDTYAPNLTSVAGATIGARLIARAGGVDKLAILPASTIQVLGAEKALFRALKTGSRPPKHGIIFQHQVVHSAPKWQRGKIARSLAGKIAIAARVDAFRGSRDEGLKQRLDTRIEEIKTKYGEPRKPETRMTREWKKKKMKRRWKSRGRKQK